MTLYIVSAGIGLLLYFISYYFVLRQLPDECRQGIVFHRILSGITVCFMATAPVWCRTLPEWIGAVGTAACFIVIITTDKACYWIPDSVVTGLFLINGLLLAGRFITVNISSCIIVMTFFIGLYVFFPSGIGSGDIKLALALSLGCRGDSAYMMTLAAFAFAVIGAVLLWACKQRTVIPFGPYLLAGWWFAAVAGEECTEWLLLM